MITPSQFSAMLEHYHYRAHLPGANLGQVCDELRSVLTAWAAWPQDPIFLMPATPKGPIELPPAPHLTDTLISTPYDYLMGKP